ncbi:FHA domain-containing protein [Isoptericola sp. 4D.3]|uniref:FHA domain-containing protein n=1 Tax=Isoptericola peretonis TaxID=2918523 RepID=A0ABT0IZJ2_9MICO|nr:FHA domain-containing protein [Isoptericola sp. 4D.3]
MTVRYVIGPAYAVVRGGAVVVLPEKVTPELVDELWTTLGSGGGVVPVLEVLTGSFGASLASLPPFAIAVADGRRVQVAARGATSVTVARADDRQHVSGEGVTTWAERTFEDVVDLAVQVGVTEAEHLVDGRAMPLDAGVVLVTSVGARLTDEAMPAAPARRQAPVRDPWEDDGPDEEPATPVVPVAAVPKTPVAAVPAGDPDPLGASESTIAPDATLVPALTVTSGEVPRLRPVDAVDDADAGPADDDEAAESGDEGAATSSEGDAPVEETTGYGHLWGSTVHRAVEAAAVRPDEEEDEDGEADGDGGPQAGPAPVAAVPVAAALVTAAPADGAGRALEQAHEQARGGASDRAATEHPSAPGAADVEEIDGSTVLSSAIADLRAAAGTSTVAPPAEPVPGPQSGGAVPGAVPPPGPAFASAPAPGRPMILARSCTAGHPNPPQRDDCGTCGKSLVGEARQVPRPPLGTMGVSGGPRVTLDRPVVVGRKPRSPRATGDDVPRLVTVPSPQQDISRSHVEVRLEGWHVLVSDMSTTNGTTLLRSGQPPLRLHPGEAVMVVSRDVVDLGDGVTLTFEGIL